MVQLPALASGIDTGCLNKALKRVSFQQANKDFSDDTHCAGDKCCDAPSNESPAAVDGLCSSGSSSPTSTHSSPAESRQSLRCGHAADQGQRRSMEDSTFISGLSRACAATPSMSGIFAVFDGHHGSRAAEFASQHILQGITESQHFPSDIGASMSEAFMQIDRQYYATLCGCTGESAGTTALAALVWGSTVYVANAGDSRAVISRCGKAVELTRDHKPHEPQERERIHRNGGFVCDEGRLCGELSVARAIGDYHLPQLKRAGTGVPCPLTAEPELTEHQLTDQDEFMLLGCDGLWDVFPSQRAVEFARARLRVHNDPQRCAEELVAEALRMHSSDNITVICCCFGDEPPRRRVYGNGRFSRSVSREALTSLAAALNEQTL